VKVAREMSRRTAAPSAGSVAVSAAASIPARDPSPPRRQGAREHAAQGCVARRLAGSYHPRRKVEKGGGELMAHSRSVTRHGGMGEVK
jgi:hypothetical protein